MYEAPAVVPKIGARPVAKGHGRSRAGTRTALRHEDGLVAGTPIENPRQQRASPGGVRRAEENRIVKPATAPAPVAMEREVREGYDRKLEPSSLLIGLGRCLRGDIPFVEKPCIMEGFEERHQHLRGRMGSLPRRGQQNPFNIACPIRRREQEPLAPTDLHSMPSREVVK